MCLESLALAAVGSGISGLGGMMDARTNAKREAMYGLQQAQNDYAVSRAMNEERDATLTKLKSLSGESDAAFRNALASFTGRAGDAGVATAGQARLADYNKVIDSSGGQADAPYLASSAPMSRAQAARTIAAEIANVKSNAAAQAKLGGYKDAHTGVDSDMQGASGRIATLRNLAQGTAGSLQDRQTLRGASVDNSAFINPPKKATGGQIFQAIGGLLGRTAGRSDGFGGLAKSFFG